MTAVRAAFAKACAREGFRLVHFAVMSNHVHYIVEADDARSLARGMQGLSIRVARGVNRVAGRVGRVFADRYHAEALPTPRQVRHALRYVLLNRQRHNGGIRVRFVGGEVDPCSSGAVFDGWARAVSFEERAGPETTAPAGTWLLRVGWRRHGAIDPREVPGPR